MGKKPFYKRWWFIALAVIFVVGVFGGDDDDAEAEVDEQETEEIAKVEETEEKPEETEQDEDVVVDQDLINEINKEIADMVEWDHGVALGTLDGEGEPIEDGEPDEFYAHTLYISSITYDGDGLELQTNADFLQLSDDDKKYVANYAQDLAQSIIFQKEEWEIDSTKHNRRFFLVIKNGEMPYGRSQVLDASEFKWDN